MKKYHYVRIDIRKKSNIHREIIDHYAEKGYRYVGFIPTSITIDGKLREVDLNGGYIL